MLDMLDKSVWADTETVFFEPACGHGNFVEAVAQRRLTALLSKAKRQKIKQPRFYAAANTLNTLWAVDIDPENIKFCRKRVWSLVFEFLWTQGRCAALKEGGSLEFIKDFLAHALCCIEWQIQENEALSCLASNPQKARLAAEKTAVSRQWLKKNGRRPIDFNKTWVWRFKTLKKKNIIPLEYKNHFKKLNALLQDKEPSVFEKNQELNQPDFLTLRRANKEKRSQFSRREEPAFSDSRSFAAAA